MNKVSEQDLNTIDCVNLVVGILIILSGIYTFWNWDVKTYMFPVIFLLATFMDCMWAVRIAGQSKIASAIFFLLGVVLFVVAFLLAL